MRCSRVFTVLGLLILAMAAHASAAAAAGSCDVATFTALTLPFTTISSATLVPAGLFVAPDSTRLTVPAFCRVAGRVFRVNNFEVWMPAAGWNGKFEGAGNGGLAGSIDYAEMGVALGRGYATASTDTGHVSSDTGWFTDLGQVVDFGYRSIHETTVKAKAIIRAYYGTGPRLSYFNSCSGGGKQGLMEAQRYPEDYNGIIAGAPANWGTHLRAGHVWSWQATHNDPASFIPASKLPIINSAVVAACDGLDGVVDGIVSDPRRCHFDPSTLLCPGSDAATCLTSPQVEALAKLYAGARNSAGVQIFPPLVPGSELGWTAVIGLATPFATADPFFRFMIFENPTYDFRTFNFDSDIEYTDTKVSLIIDAIDPDLRAFKAGGGKMIMYHGWADPLISPLNSINYYESVVNFVRPDRDDQPDGRTDQFLRLFLAPGMGHCSGGNGPNTFDALGALEQWVEHGIAPDKIIATRTSLGFPANINTPGVGAFTRPLCPHPQEATYIGHGSTDDAANFVCRVRHEEGDRDH